MKTEDKKIMFAQAISLWGLESQIGMFYEEVGELMQAINKHKRSPTVETADHVNEEFIDVKIIMGQIELTLDASRLKFWEDFKLGRLQKRIAKTIKEREEQKLRAQEQAGARQNLFNTLYGLGIIALGEEMNEIIEAIKRDEEEY